MDTFLPNNTNDNEEYFFRYIELDDYYKGYFDLLAQLTMANTPTYEEWTERLNKITETKQYFIIVVEHKSSKKIVGTITCLLEYKFIRNLGTICHIEDFVVDSHHRKMRLGSKLLSIAKEIAIINKCYKILLDCEDNLVEFYSKNGYSRKSSGMAYYFK